MMTPRETEIVEVLRKGILSPTAVAAELHITQSGATQALQKLEKKGVVTRTKVGRNAFYRPVQEEEQAPEGRTQMNDDIELIRESYHALSRVWGHVLKLDLTHEELSKVREARNLLEEILTKRGRAR